MSAAARCAFALGDLTAFLARTPYLLDARLRHLRMQWLACDEGIGTSNALATLGHSIDGEISDWMPRGRHLLEHGEAVHLRVDPPTRDLALV